MYNFRSLSKQSSFRQSNSSQNHILMDSPRFLIGMNNQELEDFFRSPQIIYDMNSQINNPPNLSREVSSLILLDQQPLILRSGRTLSYNNEKQDQTQDQNVSKQKFKCQTNQQCLQQVESQQECVNMLLKQNVQESQAFKFQKKNYQKVSENQQQPCNCKNSGCLRRYCRCFHSGLTCLPECQCSEECLNNEQNVLERSKAIKYVNEKCYRNKKIPKDALFKLDVIYGCFCTKSKCRKRYCECFLRNQNCTKNCRCFDCCNRSNISTSK